MTKYRERGRSLFNGSHFSSSATRWLSHTDILHAIFMRNTCLNKIMPLYGIKIYYTHKGKNLSGMMQIHECSVLISFNSSTKYGVHYKGRKFVEFSFVHC